MNALRAARCAAAVAAVVGVGAAFAHDCLPAPATSPAVDGGHGNLLGGDWDWHRVRRDDVWPRTFIEPIEVGPGPAVMALRFAVASAGIEVRVVGGAEHAVLPYRLRVGGRIEQVADYIADVAGERLLVEWDGHAGEIVASVSPRYQLRALHGDGAALGAAILRSVGASDIAVPDARAGAALGAHRYAVRFRADSVVLARLPRAFAWFSTGGGAAREDPVLGDGPSTVEAVVLDVAARRGGQASYRPSGPKDGVFFARTFRAAVASADYWQSTPDGAIGLTWNDPDDAGAVAAAFGSADDFVYRRVVLVPGIPARFRAVSCWQAVVDEDAGVEWSVETAFLGWAPASNRVRIAVLLSGAPEPLVLELAPGGVIAVRWSDPPVVLRARARWRAASFVNNR